MSGVDQAISIAQALIGSTLRAVRTMGSSVPRMFPIAYKLALAFTLIVSAGMIVLGWVIANDQAAMLEQQIRNSSHTLAQQLAQMAKEPVLADDGLTLEATVTQLIEQRGVLAGAIYAQDSRPIVQAGLAPDPALVVRGTKDGLFVYTTAINHDAEPLTIMAAISPMLVDGVTVGYALIGFDRSLVESAKRQTMRTVTLATLLLVLVGSLVSIILGRRLTRPIQEIVKLSGAISAGDYQARFTAARNDELGELMRAMNDMTSGLEQKERVERLFSRYVAPPVAREVLRDTAPAAALARTATASVLFADVAGFTALAERLPADEINTLLNEYFDRIAPIVEACEGHIDKYIGDCVMAVFGVPDCDPLHAQHAVECAALIQYVVDMLNERRRARGQAVVMFHIGVNSGAMLAGNVGAADRMEYTVMGKEVNVAARLSSSAEPGQILLSEATYRAVRAHGVVECVPHGLISLRGTALPVMAYAALLDRVKHEDLIRTRVDLRARQETVA